MDGKELPFLPPKRGQLFIVPNGIRPVMQRTGIEVRDKTNLTTHYLLCMLRVTGRLFCHGPVTLEVV